MPWINRLLGVSALILAIAFSSSALAEQMQCSDVEITVSPVDGRDGHYRASMTISKIGSGKPVATPSVDLIADQKPAVVMVGEDNGPRVRLGVSLDQAASSATIEVTCFDGDTVTTRYKTRVALSRSREQLRRDYGPSDFRS